MQRRLNLIDLVIKQGFSIAKASKRLELKPYTAASIISIYKETGKVFDLKARKYIHSESFCP